MSPKRLQSPGPGSSELDLMLQAALRAPDHGSLRPWRVIEFRAAQRAALAQCFEDEKRRRDPLASLDDLSRARSCAAAAGAAGLRRRAAAAQQGASEGAMADRRRCPGQPAQCRAPPRLRRDRPQR
ncbi:hypothetical protein [Methylibium sp.]|uniref:hypothetical protein n=1 Tax=Methylibium sp. TaxID=2067992 RepID=UPI003D0A2341